MELTKKQAEFIKLAEKKLQEIGGIASITRNRDKQIRENANIDGTFENTIMKAVRMLRNPSDNTDDAECQRLIEIIK